MARRFSLSALWVIALATLLLSSAGQAQEKIVYGSSTGGGIRLVTDIIKAQRLDEKNGIVLDLKYFAGPKGQQALILGKVDATYFSPLTSALQLAEGNHFVNFEIMMDSHISLLKPKGSPLKSLADVRGKRLGFIPRTSAAYMTFRILNAMQGRDADKDFQLIVGNPMALMAFIARGEVDASIHYEPFSTMLLVNGQAEQIAWYEDLWRETTKTPLLFSTLAASQSWIDAHPKAARTLARIVGATRAWIVAHPDEALEIGRKALEITDPRVIAALKERMLRIYRTPWNEKALEAGRWQVEKAVELGLVPKPTKEILALLN
ncbi:MAG: ABC transporter substrate-binding protein [Candidatus Tectomicrobia bacterium]|nr:ABC transporter substrate-binding protein [Candidatus Tectomicrobia bacterium]